MPTLQAQVQAQVQPQAQARPDTTAPRQNGTRPRPGARSCGPLRLFLFRQASCFSSPTNFLAALMYVRYFRVLINSPLSETRMYFRILEFWTGIGVVAAFFATTSNVGFVEVRRRCCAS